MDLHIYPAVGANKAAQFVLFNDIVREEIQGEFHVLVPNHGSAVVEIYNIDSNELGVGG